MFLKEYPGCYVENGWWEGGGAGTGSKSKARETSLMNCNLLTGKGWMFVAWIRMVKKRGQKVGIF